MIVFLTATLALLTVATAEAQEQRPTDEWLTKPVDDTRFQAYLELFLYDTDVPFQTHVTETSRQDDVVIERLTFQSTPGVDVTAILFHAAGSDVADNPALVFLHGGIPSGKNAGYIGRMASFLVRAGYSFLAIDMMHFGERNDGMFETFSESEKHEKLYNNDAAYLAWMQQTVKDVGRSYDYLVRERGVSPDRVGLVGMSRGGMVSTVAGGADDRFGAVVLLHSGHFDYFEDGHRPAACPANYIGRISPRALFMLNTEDDRDLLPLTSVRPLQALARDPMEFRWRNGAHGFMDEQDLAAIADWLRVSLP